MPRKTHQSPDPQYRRLVENAFDFLGRAIEELELHPKYSLINFYAAVELFLKARLMFEHWSLIVANKHQPDWNSFIAGDFVSVSLEEAAVKLEKIVRSRLTAQELRAFNEVRKHRNKMVHFYHESSLPKEGEQIRQVVAKQQLTAWYFLHKILAERWWDVFSDWSSELSDIDTRLRKHHAFLEVIFEDCKVEIQRRSSLGTRFEPCPSCGFPSKGHQEELHETYESCCIVCGLTDTCIAVECPSCNERVTFVEEGFADCPACHRSFEPISLAETLDGGQAAWASKDGDDSWALANCDQCDGYHTVMRRGDEEYFCTSCFATFDSVYVCGFCHEPNTGDMEDSYVTGCNHCDGLSGWKDD